jgi:hypothetical protein
VGGGTAASCADWNERKRCADLPLDSPVDNKADCYCVSAGTNKHEHTSGFAIESVFNFFQVRRSTPSNKLTLASRCCLTLAIPGATGSGCFPLGTHPRRPSLVGVPFASCS